MARTRRPITVAIIAVGFLAIVIWLLFPIHEPPKVVGIELGADGQPSRQIVYEASYRATGWLPDAEGGHQTRIRCSHYFLETSSARQELKFLPRVLPDAYVIADMCLPVAKSSLWIAAGFYRSGPQIEVVVFDPMGVRTQRTIPVANDWRTGRYFWFENGNATLRFRSSSGGVGTYDVASDTVRE
jgi:hypothetical protein